MPGMNGFTGWVSTRPGRQPILAVEYLNQSPPTHRCHQHSGLRPPRTYQTQDLPRACVARRCTIGHRISTWTAARQTMLRPETAGVELAHPLFRF
jgi:hypothetical protein